MKDFSLILKLVLKNTFRGYNSDKQSKKKTALLIVLVIIGCLPLLGIISFICYTLSSAMAGLGRQGEFLSVLIGASQMVIIFFGIQSVLAYTFMSKDNEFLLQLPVKITSIFAVKFCLIYISELVLSAIILLPTLIAFAVGVAGTVPFYFYLFVPLIILFAPVIPIIIVTILAFPIAKLINALKGKSVISLILLTVVFVGLMVGYYLLIPMFEGVSEGGAVSDMITTQITNLSKLLFFNRALALAVCGVNFWANFGIFFGILVAGIGIIGLLSVLLLKKSMLEQLESPLTKGKQGLKVEGESVDKALFRREVKNLFGDINFAFNSIMGSIMTPLMIAVMGFMGVFSMSDAVSETGEVLVTQFGNNLSQIGFLLMFSLISLCGMNYSATLGFSREGKTFYINKYLPVSPMQIVAAKLKLADLISLAGIILTGIVAFAVLKLPFLYAVFAIGAVTLFALGFNRLGLYRDIKRPNINWNNANEAIKKDCYPVITMFYGMGFGFVSLMLSMLIGKAEGFMPNWAILAILFGAEYVLAIAWLIFSSLLIAKNAERRFNDVNDL